MFKIIVKEEIMNYEIEGNDIFRYFAPDLDLRLRNLSKLAN
jgi:hypothetical protein